MAGAVAILVGVGLVTGTLVFTAQDDGTIRVTGIVEGLGGAGNYAFHIHQYGDVRNGCKQTGGHFNPFNTGHGAPTDVDRHVGDLGNIEADSNGVADVDFTDNLISFSGDASIIGRSVVLHATEDTGKGWAKSATIACGTIDLTS